MNTTRFYLLFSIVFLLSSYFVLSWKGYFQVRRFVTKESRVESYLNSKNYNYFTFEPYKLERDLKGEFSYLKKVSFNRNFNLTIDVEVKPREPFGILGNTSYYVSREGVVFSNTVDSKDGLVRINPKNFEELDQILTPKEVEFIGGIKDYNKYIIFLEEDRMVLEREGFPTLIVLEEPSEPVKASASINEIIKDTLENDRIVKEISLINNKLVLKE